MFSEKVEYALRAVTYLASQAPEARTIDQIAEVTRVKGAAYLAKVVQELVRRGILHSQRGVKGGITLARKPEELTILEVVNAIDPIQRISHCPLDLEAHGVVLCPLHKRLDAALASVEDAFRRTTLAEILSEPTRSIPLCDRRVEIPVTR
jgi:Rrf2 family protein